MALPDFCAYFKHGHFHFKLGLSDAFGFVLNRMVDWLSVHLPLLSFPSEQHVNIVTLEAIFTWCFNLSMFGAHSGVIAEILEKEAPYPVISSSRWKI